MSSAIRRALFNFNKSNHLQWAATGFHTSTANGGKHWNPKFRAERTKKFIKVELPDFDAIRADSKLSPEEMRSHMKEQGMVPPRSWIEKPMFLSTTNMVVEPYVPPEGDGKAAFLSTSGAKQGVTLLQKKGKSFIAYRKVKNFLPEFDLPELAEKCQEFYITAHEAFARNDEDALHLLVTEKCYPEMMANRKLKTVRWKFIQSLEIPRVVQLRTTDMLSKENIFAQATVRFHTQQTLAVYDRFGRLLYGSEAIVKDVLEYVVFENHLANEYGEWRIHGKIIPDWMPPKDPIIKTFVRPKVMSEEEVDTTVVEKTQPGATV